MLGDTRPYKLTISHPITQIEQIYPNKTHAHFWNCTLKTNVCALYTVSKHRTVAMWVLKIEVYQHTTK